MYRLSSGVCAALASLLCPIAPLIVSAILFIFVDFLTGVAASRAQAQREGRRWWFESRRAWRTVLKAGFVAVAIVMAWTIDCYMLDFMHLRLAHLFTGFVCGVELWSFLENAATISQSPLLTWLSRYVRRRIDKEVGDE